MTLNKKERTREMILDKSYPLFARDGFHKVTMKDVCDATGLSRGGLYSHFSGTKELFEAILVKINMKDEMDFHKEMEEGMTAEDILERALRLMRQEMEHSEDSLALAMYEYASITPKSQMENFTQIGEQKWTDLIQYGIKRGEFQEVDVFEIVSVILYVYQGVRMWSRIINMTPETFDAITNHIRKQLLKKEREVILYVHGKGGNADEAEHYRGLFKDADVYGLDYKAQTPWEARVEFQEIVRELSGKYKKITLIANSIGAFFSMQAGLDKYVERAYFISPIANMERLIMDMMTWAGVSEKDLEERKVIPVDFGDDLSWEYLQYVRKNPNLWSAPTEILYGSGDTLQSLETIQDFAKRVSANVTVMDGGEHWFHTKEQMEFLDDWMRRKIVSR